MLTLVLKTFILTFFRYSIMFAYNFAMVYPIATYLETGFLLMQSKYWQILIEYHCLLFHILATCI